MAKLWPVDISYNYPVINGPLKTKAPEKPFDLPLHHISPGQRLQNSIGPEIRVNLLSRVASINFYKIFCMYGENKKSKKKL